MRRGFTIVELLVASFLLGLLTTILTMIMNQSSIAWRTGTAMVSDLDGVRDSIAELREEADNAFVCHGHIHRHITLWDRDGNLNDRACDAHETNVDDDRYHANMLENREDQLATDQKTDWSAGQNVFTLIRGDMAGRGKTYIVNVMSAGPDKKFDTWDDIWSYPDDFD